MTVTSPTAGWTGEVYAVDGAPPSNLAGWGKALDHHDAIAGSTTFNLHGKKAGAVLIWITHLGADGVTKVGEVKITGVAAT